MVIMQNRVWGVTLILDESEKDSSRACRLVYDDGSHDRHWSGRADCERRVAEFQEATRRTWPNRVPDGDGGPDDRWVPLEE